MDQVIFDNKGAKLSIVIYFWPISFLLLYLTPSVLFQRQTDNLYFKEASTASWGIQKAS